MEKLTVYTKPSMTLIEILPEEGILDQILGLSDQIPLDPDPNGDDWP